MKKIFYTCCLLMALVTSCKDDDINKFDKSADERVADAIATLKADLIAPANGWRLKYTPEDGSGSFWVLLKFDDNGQVNIQTDLGADDGAYYNQTITYRIDSSLGLELIMENYSFFSYLFEQFDATFPAEYEFIYANKTPDGELVFQSKSDRGFPTILVFEEADADDEELLGKTISQNLTLMAQDIQRFSSAYKMTYQDKDIILYMSLDDFRRNATISTASKKSNINTTKVIDFVSPYIIQGDSIIFDNVLSGTFLSVPIKIKSIKLNSLSDASLDACGSPIPTHTYSGITSNSDDIILEPSLIDPNGKSFTSNQYMSGPITTIFNNGVSAGAEVAENITGAAQIQIYYNYGGFYGIGFFIRNADGTRTFALRQFTPTLNGNNIIFNFAPDITVLESPTEANVENVNIYLEHMTQGDQTYVYEYSDGIYEFYNPCSGWSFIFYAP